MEFEPTKRFFATKYQPNIPGSFQAAVLILLGSGFTPAFSAGVEWTLTPTATLQQNYTDNFNLTDDDALDVWSTEVSGGLTSKFQSDQWVAATQLSYLHEQFWGSEKSSASNETRSNTSLNRDDALASLDSTYNISPYWQFDLNGSYKRDQPRSSDPDLQTGDVLFDRITRLTGAINPGLTWLITEQTSLGISYEFIDVAYSDVENPAPRVLFPQSGAVVLDGARQTDFFRHIGALTLTHQLAEPTSIFASAGYNRTVNDDLITENDQYIISAGIDHAFTDTFAAAVSAGGIWVKSDTPELIDDTAVDANGRQAFVNSTGDQAFADGVGGFVDATGTAVANDPTFAPQVISVRSADRTDSNARLGYLVNLELRKKLEYSQLSALYSHNFIPTISGGILEEDRVTLQWQHDWTEYFRSTVDLLGSTTDPANNGAFENGRKSAVGRVELAWRFTENLFLAGGYRYRWQNQDARTGRDSSNDVFVSLRYDWDPYFVMP